MSDFEDNNYGFKIADQLKNFDVDAWADLAVKNPKAFEQVRTEVVDTFIKNAPEDQQRRLRGTQFQLDLEREQAGTALESCINLYAKMIEMVYGPGGLQKSLKSLVNGDLESLEKPRTQSAEIIPLAKKRVERILNRSKSSEK